MYCHDRFDADAAVPIRLLGSGAILREVLAAASQLAKDFGIASEVWSVTSYSELAREAAECERWNRLHPLKAARTSHLESCLIGSAPIVAASDYVRAVPQMLASYLPGRRFVTLGTDGFGRSDTRSALRGFFEVDRASIVLAALQSLVDAGVVERARLSEALERLQLPTESRPSWRR
jgi:pyruvate dehydrogenase E1 component